MNIRRIANALAVILLSFFLFYGCRPKEMNRLNTVVDMNVGETSDVSLVNGEVVKLAFLGMDILRDSVRYGIRGARLRISVDDQEITIGSGNYNLPVIAGKVRIDCPVLKETTASSSYYTNGVLAGDARFRLWPKDSPIIQPGTFEFPLKQKLFASRTQSQNEPAGLGWAEPQAERKNIGYHSTHDFGGAEAMNEIFSATDGLIVSSNNEVLKGYEDLPGDVRPDVVWVVDGRGWYLRYSHLNSVEPEMKIGNRIIIGQRVGFMGKQGGSGGWVHLHFGVHYKDPVTSRWEVEDAWPYLWESYVKIYKPSLIAIARPHLLAFTGQEITLDGSRSVSLKGTIVSYHWKFTDGTTADGAAVKRTYTTAGEYSEILEVTDSEGNKGYDFQYVQVNDKNNPDLRVPKIHASYYPTLDIKAGDPVTFLVRTFGSDTGDELWDFGDGTEKVTVNSGVVQRKTQNSGKYAETVHSFAKPGSYIVRVERTNENGFPAIGHLSVVIE